MAQKSLFNKVVYQGILGALIGIGAGILLSLLIWGLELVVSALQHSINPNTYASSPIPLDFIAMLGMGFGALSGSVLGGMTALFEQKKSNNNKN